jgi:hypothetical protein
MDPDTGDEILSASLPNRTNTPLGGRHDLDHRTVRIDRLGQTALHDDTHGSAVSRTSQELFGYCRGGIGLYPVQSEGDSVV